MVDALGLTAEQGDAAMKGEGLKEAVASPEVFGQDGGQVYEQVAHLVQGSTVIEAGILLASDLFGV